MPFLRAGGTQAEISAKLGWIGCAYQLLSSKGHRVSFHYWWFGLIIASVLAKNVTYCTNSTKLDKISVRMARTQPGCVGKFSVVVLILMFTKQKKSNSQRSVLTVIFGRQPICATANFFSRGGSDRPYFLTFLARTQASMILHIKQKN